MGFLDKLSRMRPRWWTRVRLIGFQFGTRWEFERRHARYSFDIQLANETNRSVTVQSVRLERPRGGMLRYDPPGELYGDRGEMDAERSRKFGPPVPALSLDMELKPGARGHFNFVLIPPGEWLKVRFVAKLEVIVHGRSKNTPYEFRIRQRLSSRARPRK